MDRLERGGPPNAEASQSPGLLAVARSLPQSSVFYLPRLALLFLTVLERQVSHFLVSLGYPGRAGVAER